MNTIQTQNTLSPTSTNSVSDVDNSVPKLNASANDQIKASSDRYSATVANDAVVARVISSSIDKSFSGSVDASAIDTSPSERLDKRFSAQSQSDEILPNIQSVTANVVGFVESALANLAKRGFDKEQLSFFRNEAVTGVEVGIDRAKLDLVSIASEDVFKTIDATKHSIIDGINELSIEPSVYERLANTAEQVPKQEFAAIALRNSANELLEVDFQTRIFSAASSDNAKSIYTTSSSNISFSLQGSGNESQQDIANLLNKIDGLANSFYRGEIEGAYSKSMELGYSDNEIIGLAKQSNKTDTFQQMKVYGDIQHLASVRNQADFAAPKSVADYVNRYLDVIESSKSALSTEDDFSQVINGLVSQMKDVQVPDLLQAINRFHAFNNKFA
ncbi:MAG: hypothetical protein ACJAVV_003190 [Alphaproteobacteria bacterium]|jgi:hypothetical protein